MGQTLAAFIGSSSPHRAISPLRLRLVSPSGFFVLSVPYSFPRPAQRRGQIDSSNRLAAPRVASRAREAAPSSLTLDVVAPLVDRAYFSSFTEVRLDTASALAMLSKDGVCVP